MSTLELRSLVKSFDDIHVIRDVNLSVVHGEFVVFVGPSGCGKSTLLRMIAGLETATSGDVRIDDQRVNDVSAAERGCAMVFQSYALYPHMTVYANMAFGLENAGVDKKQIEQQVNQAAALLRLDALLQRRPTQLSGGQRQRVAIGRAIVRDPKIFLFDEPLSNLDAELRVSMRSELRDLHRRLGATMIYVTHDQVEAMTLADRIVVLRDGRIEQVGSPKELYQRPINTFVAGFIGSPRMNFIPLAALPAAHVLRADVPAGCDQIGIRPEHFEVDPAFGASGLGLQVTVRSTEYMGSNSLLQGQLQDGTAIEAILNGAGAPERGQAVWLQAAASQVHAFGKDGVALHR